jgi:hypothetical protein
MQFPLVCFDQMCHYRTDLVCFELRGGYYRQTCANVRLTRHTSMKKQNHIKVIHKKTLDGAKPKPHVSSKQSWNAQVDTQGACSV